MPRLYRFARVSTRPRPRIRCVCLIATVLWAGLRRDDMWTARFPRLTPGLRGGLVAFEERGHADRRRTSRSSILKKVEALCFGAATAGERDAAEAAAERLKAKLEEVSRLISLIQMKFSLPDEWSVWLFIALCRRYGIRPFRYPRQRATTIMVGAPRRFFDTVVWWQVPDLHTDLWLYFEQTTERLIRRLRLMPILLTPRRQIVEPASLR